MTLTFIRSPHHTPLRRQVTHVARIMSSIGVYPSRTIVTADSLFSIGKSICFSVVRFDPNERESFDFYSEVEWATLNEIQLYASLLLSTRREESYTCIYPYRYPLYVHLTETLEDKCVQRRIRNALIDRLRKDRWQGYPFRGMSAPPALDGEPYDFRNNSIRENWQRILKHQINVNDHLLMRGLSTLLRAVMLWQHFQFAEEALNTIYISLEASFQLILRALKTQGYKNPSSRDAANFLKKAFFEDTPEMRYFEEFYDNRVRSIHPESRFGVYAHAPVMIDDFMHLRDSLIEVYAYIISGLINPSLLEYVISQNRRIDLQAYGGTLRLKRMWKADPKWRNTRFSLGRRLL